MASFGLLLLCMWAIVPWVGLAGRPFNVSYDSRAILIDGKRRLLISAGIHYPRATPEMWPELLRKAKDGGANVIQTYVFWNAHEPVKGQYHFTGRYDLVKFINLVDEAGLMLHLRLGPYVCAEWNYGGLPIWLRDIPDIIFRTNNTYFQEEMSLFLKKVVSLMKENQLFCWQGGPIILAQIENEYGDVEHAFGEGGKQYVKWAAALAQSLNIGIPWIMCQQNDAPPAIVDSCNGFYCDGFRPNSNRKPALWTEDWNGWYTSWGDPVSSRPVEDNAFAVARFFQKGGSFHNYYMYFGGTNFGHTSGGPFVTTSYDYDAPIDEFGLLRQPKWGHLRELHVALKLCEKALFKASSEPLYLRLGPEQEAHVYGDFKNGSLQETLGVCAAFLANVNTISNAQVCFNGQTYKLPPWSVSILPDCRHVAYNSAKVSAQTSLPQMIKLAQLHKIWHLPSLEAYDSFKRPGFSWKSHEEPVGIWSNTSLSFNYLSEHLELTKDSTDYLWYVCRFEVSVADILLLSHNVQQAVLSIEAMRDAVSVFANKKFVGFVAANTSYSWVKVEKEIPLKEGWNEIAILSSTVGLQNYGAFLERDGAGLRGQVLLTGLPGGNINLTNMEWHYEVGLQGEFLKIYSEEEMVEDAWTYFASPFKFSHPPMTWYKAYFDAPPGDNPVAIDLSSMGKGEIWLNGISLGRYWPAFHATSTSCKETCDYRGIYSSSKCLTGCGQPTQRWYHVPRSWIKMKDNSLVLFEETGGDVTQISLVLRYQGTICAHVSEFQPTTSSWLQELGADFSNARPQLELRCDEGFVVSQISFASFGNPAGRCGKFQQGHCHFTTSTPLVETACIGKHGCEVEVAVDTFGEDVCPGIVPKSLAVEAVCTHISLGLPVEHSKYSSILEYTSTA